MEEGGRGIGDGQVFAEETNRYGVEEGGAPRFAFDKVAVGVFDGVTPKNGIIENVGFPAGLVDQVRLEESIADAKDRSEEQDEDKGCFPACFQPRCYFGNASAKGRNCAGGPNGQQDGHDAQEASGRDAQKEGEDESCQDGEQGDVVEPLTSPERVGDGKGDGLGKAFGCGLQKAPLLDADFAGGSVVLGDGRLKTTEAAAGRHAADDDVRSERALGDFVVKGRENGCSHEAVGSIDIPHAFAIEEVDAEA